nr:hypothetical protein [uncultured Dysosmobacter sp.]
MDIWIDLAGAVLPGIVTGVVLAWWNRKQKERDQANEEKELQRRRSEEVRISLLVAAAKLSYAVAMAVKRGRPNGEIEEGIEQYKEAIIAFKKFERELVAEKSADI